MEEILRTLEQQFAITQQEKMRDDLLFVDVKKDQIISLLTYLKDYAGFTHLAFLQAVDRIEDNKFQLTYMLYSFQLKTNLGIRVFIDREKAEMISIDKLWAHAWQYQRELKEMYGIDFPGSPRVDESFVLESWEEMPPMKRDFDTLEYSIKTYYQRQGRSTNDPKKYMKKKLYNNFAKSPDTGRKND